jgi:hypothetical protein
MNTFYLETTEGTYIIKAKSLSAAFEQLPAGSELVGLIIIPAKRKGG